VTVLTGSSGSESLGPFARFTPESREAVVFAQAEAVRLRHPWLGTEHLLLGLLRSPGTRAGIVLASLGVSPASVEHELIEELGEPSGEAFLGKEDADALRSVGIDLSEVRRRVEETFGPGALERARPGRCGIPVMPRLKQSFEHASRAARGEAIDTDHLLLGMTQVRGALGMILLQRLGIGEAHVRSRLETHRPRAS
jgi:ATP-dependent Clp protease ATP-binding subunit ClpA